MHGFYAPKMNYSCAASGELLRSYQQLNTPLGNLTTSGHLIVLPDTPLSKVLTEMEQHDSHVSVIVTAENKLVGIFTKKDLLSRVVIPRLSLDQPISTVMTPHPVTLLTKSLGYEAVVAMAHHGIHHVVLEEDGSVVGVVSEHDLFTLQQVSFGQIAATINMADDYDTLRLCAQEIENLVQYMFVQGVSADQVTLIISTLNDQLIRRVIDLEMATDNLMDVRVCWVIMGSEGRYEQTISTDQDNGIIFEHPKHVTPDSVRTWLIPKAKRINEALDSIGFPLCKGNIMAGNPECCLSLSEWKMKFQHWICEPTPESLLKVSIYFDFRSLHGHLDLAYELRLWLAEATIGQVRFLNLMSDIALQRSPPFTFMNNFFQKNHPDAPNSTDLKLQGIAIFVDAARIYALSCGITVTRTHDRLLHAAKKLTWPESWVHGWTESFNFLQGIRIRHHHHLQHNGLKTHNRLDLCKLNELEQTICSEAFRQAKNLQKQLDTDFRSNHKFGGGGAA